HYRRTGMVLLLLIPGLVGCGRPESPSAPSAPSIPFAPSPVQQPSVPNQPVVFKDPLTGLSTSDVRDAQEHIVQFTTAHALVWTADETPLSGHFVQGPGYQPVGNFAAEPSCQCWLVVRFGASNGERRAYLTGDYGHENPGTVVALDVAGGALIVSR